MDSGFPLLELVEQLYGQAVRYWWFLAGFVVLLVVALWAKAGGLAGGYRKPKGPAADAIARAADWRQFERLTALALREAGYRVRENSGAAAKADGGVDLVARGDDKPLSGPAQASALVCQRKGRAGTVRRDGGPRCRREAGSPVGRWVGTREDA